MRKIVAATFVSLDGVMQAPSGPEEDPAGGFEFGGWTFHHWDEAMGENMGDLFATPFDLLLGRRTYDIFAAFWPYADKDDAVAKLFNPARKYVATHRPESLTWQNSRALGTDIVADLRDLKAADGPQLLVQGSSDLIQQLLAVDLIDEFRLMIFPVVLGKGKRLFGSGTLPSAFRLTASQASTTGVIMARYERAGAVTTGSFAPESPSEAELERRKAIG
jgi:dihydrofolate reductase